MIFDPGIYLNVSSFCILHVDGKNLLQQKHAHLRVTMKRCWQQVKLAVDGQPRAADRQPDNRQEGCRSTIVQPQLAEQHRNRKKSMWRAESRRSQGQTRLRPLTGSLELTFSHQWRLCFPTSSGGGSELGQKIRTSLQFTDLGEAGHSISV